MKHVTITEWASPNTWGDYCIAISRHGRGLTGRQYRADEQRAGRVLDLIGQRLEIDLTGGVLKVRGVYAGGAE